MSGDDYVLPDWVKPGVSFRDETGSKDWHVVWHVRAVVDGDQVVMRKWSKRYGGCWRYVVEPKWFFQARRENLVPLPNKKAPAVARKDS